MKEIVVHITTLDQWKSVLDVWFEQGYTWLTGNKEYYTIPFENGGRFLFLDNYIDYNISNPDSKPFIEYSDFMSQQKENNKMETYYVTQDQYDLIEDLKNESINRLDYLLANSNKAYKTKTFNHLPVKESNAILRYLGGDDTIEFEIKEQLYRLWRVNNAENKVYMNFKLGTPDWTLYKEYAFTAPLKEIKKHKTISWEIEEVD